MSSSIYYWTFSKLCSIRESGWARKEKREMKPIDLLERWFGTLHLPRAEPGSSVWYFKRDRIAMISLLVLLIIILLAIFAPWLTPYPNEGRGEPNAANRLLPPSSENPFGTDTLGRDVLARILFGARTSLVASFVIVFVSLVFGTLLGAIAGFLGGGVEEIIMRITDIFLAFPPLLLAMVIVAVLDPSLWNAIIAISISWWPWYTRLARAQAVSIRESDYIKAARGIGVSNSTIVRRHILPNIASPILISGALDLGGAILTVAALGFIGLGAPPPTPDWGAMVSKGRIFIQGGYWWVSVFPGLALFITSMAFNLLGDSIQFVTNPRIRGGGR
jgi:peptide/nickel transport system permease protein